MKDLYILVPGLNDHTLPIKMLLWLAVQRWRMMGMRVVVFSSNWESKESYAAKQQRLDQLIERQERQGSVVLIGVSAGVSLATVAFARRRTHALVAVSGLFKLSARQWSPAELNSAWHKAASRCDELSATLSAADKHRILTFTPHHDAVIDPQYARLRGATNRHTRRNGHMGSIAEVLLGRVGEIKQFVRGLDQRS